MDNFVPSFDRAKWLTFSRGYAMISEPDTCVREQEEF